MQTDQSMKAGSAVENIEEKPSGRLMESRGKQDEDVICTVLRERGKEERGCEGGIQTQVDGIDDDGLK